MGASGIDSKAHGGDSTEAYRGARSDTGAALTFVVGV
jgi:hypothetical protein